MCMHMHTQCTCTRTCTYTYTYICFQQKAWPRFQGMSSRSRSSYFRLSRNPSLVHPPLLDLPFIPDVVKLSLYYTSYDSLFAFPGFDLPQIELQLLAFEHIAICSATLAWS